MDPTNHGFCYPPFFLGLGTKMSDPYVYVVLWAPRAYHTRSIGAKPHSSRTWLSGSSRRRRLTTSGRHGSVEGGFWRGALALQGKYAAPLMGIMRFLYRELLDSFLKGFTIHIPCWDDRRIWGSDYGLAYVCSLVKGFWRGD